MNTVLVLLLLGVASVSATNRISGVWKFRAADTAVCMDEGAFALQAVLSGSTVKLTPVPPVIYDLDGRIPIFEWAPVVGTGNEESGFRVDGEVWRQCNTTQIGESLSLTCFVKGGLGTCTFTYMCAYGLCNTSTIPPSSQPEHGGELANSDDGEEEGDQVNPHGIVSDEDYYGNYTGALPRRMTTLRDLPGITNFIEASATQCQVATFLRNVGFSASAAKMVCTAYYESSWNCAAKHMNTDGSQDYGLLQVNSYWWCSGGPRSRYNGCSATCDAMLDCQANAKCARTIFDQQGANAWYAYKAHKAECDSYYLPC